MTEDRKPPTIEGAPGIVWRSRKNGWVATWQARTDLIKRGYAPQTARLWAGAELTEIEASHIATQCRRLQSDMLMFAREGSFVADKPPLTVGDLIIKYQTDPDSSYHKKRYAVRKSHDIMLRRISATHGAEELADIKARMIKSWHKEWSSDGVKVAIAHAFVGHLRTLFGFGFTMLEDKECERLCAVMHLMKFPMPKPRTERLTADQAIALRVQGHWRGWHSIALAQAFQFELMLRQKDVIGEWVPVSEPGISATVGPKGKWLMGIRWEEIDDLLILRHNTSKRGKDIEVDLKLAPMVLEELALHTGVPIGYLNRSSLPASGAVVLCEITGFPWSTMEFRRKWRILATKAGIPKSIRNMDSRAGAISEATDAGADLEHVRHAATHSDIGMTQRYSRGTVEKVAGVSRQRVAHRNKPKTSDD